jgi:FdhD protein
MSDGSTPARWFEYRDGWSDVEAAVIEEALIDLYINGNEIASIMCTPIDLIDLAIGFLANEGFIEDIADVDHVHVSDQECCVDIWLTRAFQEPTRRIITSGCGRGVTFKDPSSGVEPLDDELQLEPDRLFEMFNKLQTADSLYAKARGVHTAGLFNGEQLVIKAEDVGRHNTIDKLRGACLRREIDPAGKVILASGRVSSEMLHKSALMRCPIVASRNSPTSLSIAMAEAWNITLVGYVRRSSLRAYTHPWRLGLREPGEVKSKT